VSYSRHDEALVKPLAGLLGVAADDAVFLDVASLKPGDLWNEKIIAAVKEASVFVLCWCCECEHSTFVAKEISTALAEGGKRLVPVLFCSTPLPPGMADRQWIDLRGKIVHDCSGIHATETKRSPRDPRDKMLHRWRPKRSGEPEEYSDEQETRSWVADAPAAASPAPSVAPPPSPRQPAPQPRRRNNAFSWFLWIAAFALVAVAVRFSGNFGFSKINYKTSILAFGAVASVIVLKYLLTRLSKPALRQHGRPEEPREQADVVADRAKSYFEALGQL
jgi:hypothetical protein